MTQDKQWKKLVRAEAARTGESYQQALQRLRREAQAVVGQVQADGSGTNAGAAGVVQLGQGGGSSLSAGGGVLTDGHVSPPKPAPDPSTWLPSFPDMVPRQRNQALHAKLDAASAASNSPPGPMAKVAWQDEGDRLSLRIAGHYAEIIWNGKRTADLYVIRLDDDRTLINRGQQFFSSEQERMVAAVQLQTVAEAAILQDAVTTASGSTPSLHADAVGTSTVAVSLNDAEEPAPRLPKWGHIQYKDKAGNQSGFRSEGFDDPRDAAKYVERMVAKAIQRDAEWAMFRVRAVGDPASTPPERIVELVIDPIIGLTGDQRAEIIGATAVSQRPLLIRVWFVEEGHEPPRSERAVHLMVELNTTSPTLELARQKARREYELRAAGASRCNVSPEGPVFETYEEAFKASRDGLDLCANCLPRW
jgi:hypothetical protein